MSDNKELQAAIERLEAAAIEGSHYMLHRHVPVLVTDLRTVLDALKQLQEKKPC